MRLLARRLPVKGRVPPETAESVRAVCRRGENKPNLRLDAVGRIESRHIAHPFRRVSVLLGDPGGCAIRKVSRRAIK